MSADGRYLLVLTPDPGGQNLYLYDRVTGTQTLVSHAPDGTPAGVPQDETPALSADGRWLAFLGNRSLVPGVGNPSNAEQVYLYDRVSGSLTLVGSLGGILAISADGRYVAAGLYLYDRITGTATVLANAGASDLLLSADGHGLAFQSEASNLVPRDFNGARTDVFLITGAP